MFIPGAFQSASAMVKATDKVVSAFEHGHGVGWHEHDRDLYCGTERFFRPGYTANLVSSWIPALDGVQAKLEAGAAVAAAKEYPRGDGSGYDLVTMFDCLHDMGDPVGASAHVLETLAPDGTWMLVEPNAGDLLQDNINANARGCSRSKHSAATASTRVGSSSPTPATATTSTTYERSRTPARGSAATASASSTSTRSRTGFAR